MIVFDYYLIDDILLTAQVILPGKQKSPHIYQCHAVYIFGYSSLSFCSHHSQVNAVGTANGYGLDRRIRVCVLAGSQVFSSILSRQFLGYTQPPIQRVLVAHSPGVKWLISTKV
jgi:hypothetical protein